MKEAFIEHRFRQASLNTVMTVNRILEEYELQGFRLSLRQLYYQLVAREYIPNTQREYKKLGELVSDARNAGLIDWDMIEDRGRETKRQAHWDSPAAIIEIAAQQFRIDKWEDQPYHLEVMVEKDALSGVLEPVCHELDIAITANKGYGSSSSHYETGKRLYDRRDQGKKVCILYLGDHDPSGIDMTRDVDERVGMYSRCDLEVVRLALNWDQIGRWKPPKNPAKETDARYAMYAQRYGGSSWELDAVEPVQLAQLVRDEVAARRDADLWAEAVAREDAMRSELRAFAEQYGGQP